MLSALVALPKGAQRNQLLGRLRRLKVRVIEPQDTPRARPGSVDLVILGSDVSARGGWKPYLRARGSAKPDLIILETSRPAHASFAYGKNAWCFHKPLHGCLLEACLRSIIDRRKLADRLARLQRTRGSSKKKNVDEHLVDDLWVPIFEKLHRTQQK